MCPYGCYLWLIQIVSFSNNNHKKSDFFFSFLLHSYLYISLFLKTNMMLLWMIFMNCILLNYTWIVSLSRSKTHRSQLAFSYTCLLVRRPLKWWVLLGNGRLHQRILTFPRSGDENFHLKQRFPSLETAFWQRQELFHCQNLFIKCLEWFDNFMCVLYLCMCVLIIGFNSLVIILRVGQLFGKKYVEFLLK